MDGRGVEGLDRSINGGELRVCLRLCQTEGDRDELVAADAEGAVPAEHARNRRARPADNAVAAAMAEAVVDDLEIVDIENHRAEIGVPVFDLLIQTADLLLIGVGVADMGQGIGKGLRVDIVEIALHLMLHGADLQTQRFHFVFHDRFRGLGGGRSVRDALLIAGIGGYLFRQSVQVFGKIGQPAVKLIEFAAHLAGNEDHNSGADQNGEHRNDRDGQRVLADLLLIPLGAEVEADHARDFAFGVEDRAVRAVEVAPAVGGRRVVNGGGALGRLDEGVCDEDLLAELARVDGIGVDGKDVCILVYLPDGIDKFDIGVVHEDKERIRDRLKYRRTHVVLGECLHHVAVKKISRRVGDIQHVFCDHRLHHGLGLVQHDEAENDVRRKQQQTDNNHVTCRQTVMFSYFQWHSPPWERRLQLRCRLGAQVCLLCGAVRLNAAAHSLSCGIIYRTLQPACAAFHTGDQARWAWTDARSCPPGANAVHLRQRRWRSWR